MRIGFVVGQFPTLSETFVIAQMAGLLERGFKVGVVCNGITDHNFHNRNEPPLSVILPQTRDWWGPLATFRSSVERFPSRIKDKLATALDTASVSRLREFDVLVAHFGQNGSRVARLKKRHRIDTPLVTIFHGFDVGAPLHAGELHFYDDLFSRGALNLTVNSYFRDVLVDAGAAPDKVAVHHMGIGVSNIPFQRRQRHGEKLRFVSVCRLIEKKGIEFALRALAQCRDTKVDWQYHIIGDGPLRGSLQALAGELGIADRVTFAGSVSHDEVKRQLALSQVFILPSITASNGDLEGIPVALMEAMASGLTVLSSYHSGIPELVENGQTGFLAAERDVEGLAGRIRWILDHPDECDDIAVTARQKVELEFNNDVLNDHFARLVSMLKQGNSH